MAANKDSIIKEVMPVFEAITRYTSGAQADSLLKSYSDTPDFLHISSDGTIRDYAGFKKVCGEYYETVKEQKLTKTREIFQVLDDSTVLLCWSGNIDAHIKNGGIMKLSNYTVTFLFKKINGEWKVIHSHESAPPPQMMKEQKPQ
jgi:ketosteroid isomerase-like protein